MANAIKWEAAFTDRGDLDSGGALDSLANAARAVMGTAVANATNLDKYGVVELELGSITPTSPAWIDIWFVRELDGTTSEDGDASTDPGTHLRVDRIPLNAATGAIRVASRIIPLPACDFEVVIGNESNVSFAGSGNACNLYTANDEVQ